MSQYVDYAKLERLKNLEDKLKIQQELPHLYGQKLYKWQREFIQCRNPMLLLTAANQIGKSSIQIKKRITLATSPHLWPVWWPKLHGLGQIPRQMWYLYPDAKVATTEFHEKWVPEFLPRGSMQTHPIFGWKPVFEKKLIQSIHFNSGPSLYFKTYAQNAQSLQTGTVASIDCFVAGTLVNTKSGLVAIEKLKVGDLVLTKDGWHPIEKIFVREKEVISRNFTNGENLTGTVEHPFWTKHKWKPFRELTP